MISHFYAMLFRMKYIDRWALMRNTRKETLTEHTLETAFIAHALAVIENRRFNGNVDADRVALFALFHDAPEIITGDLPTPVKYYNDNIKTVYKEIECEASNSLLNLLPDDLKQDFQELFDPKDKHLKKIIKAADKLSALIKCCDEISFGNRDFKAAKESTFKAVKEIDLPSVKVFLEEFMPSFSLPLDEQKECQCPTVAKSE